jgi:uncharacterized protein (DUF2147 family)
LTGRRDCQMARLSAAVFDGPLATIDRQRTRAHLPIALTTAAHCGAAIKLAIHQENNMKKTVGLVLLIALFCAGPVFAADPILGTWKLNVAKSKFSPTAVLAAATRTYSEANGQYTLSQKLTSADGKEMSYQVHYREGKEEKQTTTTFVDATLAKKIDANTWDFDLKKDGKVVGHVHRVVSADGKTLTVHNTGTQVNGVKGDQTLVFDKQ